jgi:hypothetical protein
MTRWKELDSNSQVNTAVATGALETINCRSSTSQNFNRLIVNNRDNVDIQLRLNGATTGGGLFNVPRATTLVIDASDGIWFSWFNNYNLDAVNAETAGAILFRWARCVDIGD